MLPKKIKNGSRFFLIFSPRQKNHLKISSFFDFFVITEKNQQTFSTKISKNQKIKKKTAATFDFFGSIRSA